MCHALFTSEFPSCFLPLRTKNNLPLCIQQIQITFTYTQDPTLTQISHRLRFSLSAALLSFFPPDGGSAHLAPPGLPLTRSLFHSDNNKRPIAEEGEAGDLSKKKKKKMVRNPRKSFGKQHDHYEKCICRNPKVSLNPSLSFLSPLASPIDSRPGAA